MDKRHQEQPQSLTASAAWLAVRTQDDERHERRDERLNDPRRPLPRVRR